MEESIVALRTRRLGFTRGSGSEDGERQEEEAENSSLPILLLKNKAKDRDGCYQEDSKRDEGVEFEVGGHKS